MAGATGSSLDGALYYYVQTRGVGGTEAYIYNTRLYGDPMTRVLYALRIRYDVGISSWCDSIRTTHTRAVVIIGVSVYI